MSTAAAASTSTPGGPLGGEGGAPGRAPTAHLLVVCRSAEDAARFVELANELNAEAATAGTPPPLAFHVTSPAAAAGPASSPPPSSTPNPPSLDAVGVSRRLESYGTRTMGRVLLAAASLGSTQDVLRNHGSVLGDGAVVVADRQTSGKGRGGNQWTSPDGCLMFSALRRLRVQSPAQAPLINYLVCLAITRGVARAMQESGLPSLDIRIKWPNDIYAQGVKVAGALIHTSWQGGSFNVIAGIGLNVNNRFPTTCLDELLEQVIAAAAEAEQTHGSLAVPSGAAYVSGNGNTGHAGAAAVLISRESVLAGILASLEEVYDIFERHGFAPLESEYLATWLHGGQVLDFNESPNPAQAERLTRLTVRGLSPSGFLMAEDAAGTRFELTPDGNSLDMMHGLIRRKIN